MTTTVERFSDRVENYVKYRPGYPAEVLNLFRDEMNLLRAILDRIGERKVDILLHVPGAAMPPIVEIAYRDGVMI